ncbi:hypothetical protein ABTX81_03290 [Kitasatospora sp. NPDC097605]|uniref:hypothetical protein n=1 Tax=Kitasatospora sp. NPDC097605 TaxID=3157226 RepID=UPI00331C5677
MPTEPRSGGGSAALCTLLPFVLLLALLAWAYPLTARHHDRHPHSGPFPVPTSTATPR